jgi:hypothetical protein
MWPLAVKQNSGYLLCNRQCYLLNYNTVKSRMRVPRFRKNILPLRSNLPWRRRQYVPPKCYYSTSLKPRRRYTVLAQFSEEITSDFKPTDCKAVMFLPSQTHRVTATAEKWRYFNFEFWWKQKNITAEPFFKNHKKTMYLYIDRRQKLCLFLNVTMQVWRNLSSFVWRDRCCFPLIRIPLAVLMVS